jgi:uracil-DNA glycosylase family 4
VRQGFFARSELVQKAPPSLVPRCGACGLKKTCNSPLMPVHGEGRRKVLIVGEAPGSDEDRVGRPFVGRAGQHLRAALAKVGVDLDRDCWTTNSVICRPQANATPTDDQVDYCRPNLTAAIRKLAPEAVVLLGLPAVKSLIGTLWKEDVGPMQRWAGWKIPSQELNAWVCPTHHPMYCIYRAKERDELSQRHFEQHLAAAFALEGRPWDEPPAWEGTVRPLTSAAEAVAAVEAFVARGLPVAVDYETDRLKPEGGGKALCFSVSDGDNTVAYPWLPETAEATKALLRSRLPKVASNLKFEERWTRRLLGVGVRNWAFDTMLAAHAMDNRQGITSIKFQAFVLLGQTSYDGHLEALRRSVGGSNQNRLREASMNDLLVYCGMDSLLEFKVARIQAAKLGVEL